MIHSRMREEALEAPTAVARLNEAAARGGEYRVFGKQLRAIRTPSVTTIARGSSDHAALYFAYLVMARIGRLVTSLPMSVITLYESKIDCAGLVSLAFSQSGQSPDLVTPTEYFTRGGALTAALVNATGSPLARAARFVFPLHAGEERSIAATKSFITELVSGARVVAAWREDAELEAAIDRLPETLETAARADWSRGIDVLAGADRLFVIGRGTGWPIAMEAALKLKEVCSIQAEAFSSAEVKHGPMVLIEEGYPLLVFAPRGPAQAGLLALADEMRGRGAKVLALGTDLPIVETGSIDLDPISAVQSFYGMAEAIARARGLDPDRPRHLAKVTRTQ
jgi:glutamine---fructose-6-phosphate transaminase (isomerizing)